MRKFLTGLGFALIAVGVFFSLRAAQHADPLRMSWQRYVMDGHRTGVVTPSADNVREALGESDGSTYLAPNGKTFKGGATPAVAKLLLDVQPRFASLKQVIAFAPKPFLREKPESELYDWIGDQIMKDVARLTGRKVDVGFANYGGVRTELPAGDVLADDIVSMFPFKNYLCYVALRGSDLRAIFEQLARHPQIIAGARMRVRDGKIVSLEVGGKPLDDQRIYGVATIDFLLDGGDGLKIARNARELIITQTRMMDAMLPAVKAFGDSGQPFVYQRDGRFVIEK